MTTVLCSACGMENDDNSAKCENCKSTISDDEWERNFRFIEEAELEGKVYNFENIEEVLCKAEPWNIQIQQAVKEEPEIHIEPEFAVDEHQTNQLCKEPNETRDEPHKYQCNECSRCFKRETALRSHIKALHSDNYSDSEESKSKPICKQPQSEAKISSNFKCKRCDKITETYKKHLAHMQSHDKQQLPSGLIKCMQCEKILANNFDFKIHHAQHAGVKISQCDICNAVLSNGKILQNHKVKVHNFKADKEPTSDKNRFRCDFCGERFPLQILMINHKKTHTKDTELIDNTATIGKLGTRISYICKICGKISASKTIHTEHLKVHTKEKPFKCELCPSVFTTRSSLTSHLSLHTNERPFKCNICESTFRHRQNLRRHLLRHSGASSFKCLYCEKTFTRKTSKADHERLTHTGETPYKCEVCTERFTTCFLRNSHKRSVHNIDTNIKPRVKIFENKISER